MEDYAADCTVIPVGNAELVQLAEAKLRGAIPDQRRLKNILAPFANHPQGSRMDTVVLACTHFPLLRAELTRHLGPHVALVDSGEAVARRVGHWLNTLTLEHGITAHRHMVMIIHRIDDFDTSVPV